jgi:hypothetical protein
MPCDGSNRHLRGGLLRIPVTTRTDAGERDGSESLAAGDLQTVPVAAGEQRLFARMPAPPDGSDGVNHVPGRQAVAAGDVGLAHFAAPQPAAFFEQSRASGPMDGAIHAATTK